MMGIGIGIDYVLLMVTRFREWRAAGLDAESATIATLDTAGRSVLVAGSTVVVSMLGLFAMGLSFMRGAALATIVGVLVVMVAAVTLFPALLGYFGRWIDRLRLPLGRRRPVQIAAGGHVVPSRGWVRWSRLVDRHSVIAAMAGVALLLALAAPFLGVRFGFPDAGNDAEGRSTRQAYDLVSAGFGAGANGPLVLVADLSDGDPTALSTLADDLEAAAGVAAVTPPRMNQAGDAAVLTVIPTTGPQDEATEDLVRTLRDDVVPAATDGTGLEVHVGGVTPSAIDSTANIAQRLPLLIGGVVALSMLLLLVSFRSIAIPVTAAVMNLLSVAAAYGVVALFLQGGWAGQLIGIDTATPMPAFIPVLMFAVLFGLSMDYEVFLVSRMRESWLRTRDNSQAIVDGLAGTGRVVTAAAAIMVAVFAAFIPSPEVFLKVIGVGMAAAILVDATVVRMLLVPAIMHLTGTELVAAGVAGPAAPAAARRRPARDVPDTAAGSRSARRKAVRANRCHGRLVQLQAANRPGQLAETDPLEELHASAVVRTGVVEQPADTGQFEPPGRFRDQPATDALPSMCLDDLQVSDVGPRGDAGGPVGFAQIRVHLDEAQHGVARKRPDPRAVDAQRPADVQSGQRRPPAGYIADSDDEHDLRPAVMLESRAFVDLTDVWPLFGHAVDGRNRQRPVGIPTANAPALELRQAGPGELVSDWRGVRPAWHRRPAQ